MLRTKDPRWITFQPESAAGSASAASTSTVKGNQTTTAMEELAEFPLLLAHTTAFI
jgi:hypothetical protein